jgi:hypothetical protein
MSDRTDLMRRRTWWRIAGYGAMLLLALLALSGIVGA